MKKVIIIGSGFSGLSSAAVMAKNGWDVTVIERHGIPGGRARQFSEKGFTFDMGPSWYWMPDVFERYFGLFGKKVSDYYKLQRLDPSYSVFWENEVKQIPASFEKIVKLFDDTEKDSGSKLIAYLKEASFKYDVGINKLVHKPGKSFREFIDLKLIVGIFKLDVFISIKKHIGKFFKNKKLRQLLEFPILFLGALPENTPALYSLMNYADIKLGTWYPEGGMYKIVEAMYKLATELGVQFEFNHDVIKFSFEGSRVTGLTAVQKGRNVDFTADVFIGSADYHFIETKILPEKFQSYTSNYWDSRKMAPSCLIYYVGINKKIEGLKHHSLFFDVDFQQHANEIYKKPKWPTNPLFYVSATSVTDTSVSPKGFENLFFLIPVAADLEGDTENLRNTYFDLIIERFEKRLGIEIKSNIVFRKNFGPTDFVDDYNAFKGNAYGLANILTQTSVFKPSCRSRKLPNLYYTGQLTVPGPGVPPCIISGEIVAKEILKNYN